MNQDDRIAAGKHFQIDQFTRLRHAALRLALAESEPINPDWPKIHRLCQRFRLGAAFEFYYTTRPLWGN